jgi:hypothetical protein
MAQGAERPANDRLGWSLLVVTHAELITLEEVGGKKFASERDNQGSGFVGLGVVTVLIGE